MSKDGLTPEQRRAARRKDKLADTLRSIANDIDAGAPIASEPQAIAASGYGVVNSDTLIQVVGGWGLPIIQPLIVGTAPPVEPPPVDPPPSGGMQTPSGPINLGNGSATIVDKSITSPSGTGVMIDNATHVGTLAMNNVKIRSHDYALYSGQCDVADLKGCDFATTGGGNDYVVRGVFLWWDSTDCKFANSGNKACWRIYGLVGGTSTRDTFTGERMMLGGGYADEWQSPGPFEEFTFTDARMSVASIEIYNATNRVTFDRVDFTGTHHISIQFGAHHIAFRNCTGLPEIRYYNSNGDRYYPTASQLAARGIVIT